ncbi:cation:proton antiporter [Evansella cellulosilytica]|uniref:Sodium/hydrogen exchanger n=1 Tax=Evansella cellulosilytica (strain ATCC 21833 / DSM 2522 / FERM P-1141 / JCM 9156 / N-4) TaxID=649639 RepID=E6U1T7_EVAC2|nr:cation:proton antiporter [Evansella cellulosilytica]ADU31584.1 sodium/hydrogen exchanger [Evansella cellulosilytica DSM 2522]
MVELPIQDPVKIFALTMLIFFLTPMIMSKFRIPGIIGPIIAGIIIGPNGLNILERDQTLILLGTVGLLFIIFIAGLELDIDGFKKYKHRSILFGTLSFSIPFSLGMIVCLFMGYSMMASILIGSILGSHTLLGYPIASRLGISKNKAVTTAVGGTLVTDTLALLVLAVITGAVHGEISVNFWISLCVSLTVFVLLVLLGVPRLSRWYFKNVNSEGIKDFTYVMVILFLSGFLALLAGVEPIIGAFLAGLALNRLVLDYGPLMNRIRFFGNALFIPFFLLSVGMLMDLRVLFSDPSASILIALILLALFSGKALPPYIIGKIYGYSSTEVKVMFGLTIPQAAATLAATLVGYNVGLLDQSTVNGVIIMILLSCIIGPSFVDKFGRQLAFSEEEKPYKRNEGPERILIPLSDPKTMESLLDLSFMIKESQSQDQPLYPLTVVQKEENAAEIGVAKAEKMLGHAVMYASGADMPVRLLTRVDLNVSNGIARAVTEERINIIVAGWDAKMKQKQLFGGVIDRVIDKTTQTVLVSKISDPLNTAKRVVLVVSRGSNRKPGFIDAFQKIKLIASKLNVPLVIFVVNDDTNHYVKHVKDVKPNPPTTLIYIESWNYLYAKFVPQVTNDDLIIILSARKGTIAWNIPLEHFPKKLAKNNLKNFIVYYPAEEEEVDVRGTRGTYLPRESLFSKQDEK